jgi:hypothetical protein
MSIARTCPNLLAAVSIAWRWSARRDFAERQAPAPLRAAQNSLLGHNSAVTGMQLCQEPMYILGVETCATDRLGDLGAGWGRLSKEDRLLAGN